jgi:hypothetical protein
MPAMHMTSAGRRHIEEAIALLLQNQAAFLSEQTKVALEFLEIKRSFVAIQIQLSQLDQIKAIVLRHDDALRDLHDMISKLPETIRQQIGFKPGRG